MTLRDTVRAIEALASAQPSVRMIVRNDVFRLNTIQDAQYGVFAWTQQQHTVPSSGDLLRFSFNLFYIDRLTEDKGNELEIQSAAVQTLSNVLRGLNAAGVWQAGDAAIRTFNQRFLDECAGAFCTVTLEVGADTICNINYDEADASVITI